MDSEESPLLNAQSVLGSPIQWSQFSIVLWIQLVEPLPTLVISPFAPQLIRDIGITHGDETQVGYYVGILHSVFYLVQAITVLHWSRLSDHIGRKPILLIGLFGLALSMICFGLSTTFWGLVLSRALTSTLNANVGVIKGMIAEMADSSNLAQMIAYVPITFAVGGTIGPLIGGLLSHPAERFPEIFTGRFWKSYPYFLPSAFPALLSALCWIVTYLFLRETVISTVSVRHWLRTKKNNPQSEPVIGAGESCTLMERHLVAEPERPKSLYELCTRKVLIIAMNYCLLSLIDIAIRTLQPVMFSTPISLGGLGLPPSSIGKVLSTTALLNGFFQMFFFAKIHRYLGPKKTYILGLFMTLPVVFAFPVMNYLAKIHGVGHMLWAAVALQILFTPGILLSYGAALILVSYASPNRASLGAINGFCQMSISAMRAVGPALFNSLFAASIGRQYIGGYLVYYLLVVALGVAIVSALWLPSRS